MNVFSDHENNCLSEAICLKPNLSYPSMLHHGISAAVLDKSAGLALSEDPIHFLVTKTLTTRRCKPARIDHPIKFVNRFIQQIDKVAQAKAKIHEQKGCLLSASSGLFVDPLYCKQDTMHEVLQGWRVYPDEP